MSIVEFIESLRDEITNPVISSKESALRKLSKFLSGLSFSDANADSVNCLTIFYENILCEHYDLLPSILDGISILIDFDNFTDSNAEQIARKIVKLDVPQFNVPTRLKIFELLNQLFTFYLNGLKTLDDQFLHNFLNAIDSENSPDCVHMVMKLNLVIVENLNISGVYEEYFDSISAYFPVEFKTNKNTKSNLTRDVLVKLNKQCMIASPLFGPQLLPMLLEKITADKKSARIDSLDIFGDCVSKMNFEEVFNYYMSFLDCLLFEYKNRDLECQTLSLKCVDALAAAFQNHADEKELIEFCWHLFEIISGIILDNDKKLLQFLLPSITGKSRVWCGVLINLLPPLMEKSVKFDMEDTEKMDIMANLLSVGDNLSGYRGIMDSAKACVFFIKLNELFNQIVDSSDTTDNVEQLSIVFRLLAYYSLFDIWIPGSDTETHFVTDVNTIINSRCSLISKSMTNLANNKNPHLENVILMLVPRLLQSSIALSHLENEFTKLIFSYVERNDNLQNFAFKILELVPVSCFGMVLSAIEFKLNKLSAVATVTSCLANIAARYVNDATVTDRLCMFVLIIIDKLIVNQSSLSNEAVSNFALALSELGAPRDESLKSTIINVLLLASRVNDDLPQPCVIWLCAILGQSSIQIIQESILISDLLNLLYAMILVSKDIELKSILYQTYASVINKIDDFSDVEKDFIDHLATLKDDTAFVMWNLKVSMMSSNITASNLLINIIIDPEHISTVFGSALIKNIEILYRQISDAKKHFCDEAKLFPKQSLFYEQQSFHLIAQPYRSLAIDENSKDSTKDVSMEIYLKLISSYPKSIIDLFIDEIVLTVSQWFAKLTNMSNKVSLRLEALKAICNLESSVNHLSNYVEDIAENIIAVSNSHSSLVPRDRLFLAKVIGWFIISFPNYNAVKYLASLKTTLSKLINDNKRIVRREAVKSKLILFC